MQLVWVRKLLSHLCFPELNICFITVFYFVNTLDFDHRPT